MKLTKAQQEAWDRINNRKITGPDDNTVGPYGCFEPPTDYMVRYESGREYTWYANRVYGTFNTATLKALEKKALLKFTFLAAITEQI